MLASNTSLVESQWSHNTRSAASLVWRLPLGLVALLAITTLGCRTPWRSPSAPPDFDRLIEIEQRAGQQRSTGRHPQASNLRPGPAKYAMSGETQELVPPAAATSVRRSLSDSDADARSPNQIAKQDLDEMEEMLVDVPPAQRELLRREMHTMQRSAKGQIHDKHAPMADPMPAAAEKDEQLATKSGSPIDSDDYAGSSKYKLSAQESNRQLRDTQEADRPAEQAYSRRLSDRPDAPLPRSLAAAEAATEAATEATETVVSRPPASPAGDNKVVTASYAAGSQPADSHSIDNPTASSDQSEPLEWRQHIAAALAQLEAESTASSPEEQVYLQMVDRLLHMSLGDIEAASEPIEGLQANGQDFIRHSLKSLHDVTNPSGNPVESKRYTLAMLSQRKAMSHLASVSNLEVHNAAFCTEVDGFGVVTKFPQYTFKSDQELLLYCELDNFVSSSLEGKGFETQLQGSYEIVDSNGRRVADQLLPLDSHLCRNQRRDYFIAYRIYMPQNIDAGKYQMKLTVEDLKGRKFGQSVLDFQIQ